MKDHLFVASGYGELYDTRVQDWAKLPPLRRNYNYHHHIIHSVADFKATLRAGPHAWPGGYPLYFLCEDGESLCFKCAQKEARFVMEAIKDHQPNANNGWRVFACDINYEDNDMICAHCNNKIESAYGED